MKGDKFDAFIDEIAQEFNDDMQKQLNVIRSILNDWEKSIKSSKLSTVELLEYHYKSLIHHRISRLRKLLDIECPESFIVRELLLCRQSYEEFLESDYAQRIMELHK